ncbi:thiamine pyrophosphate-dependent dehydrogenase E1 component subunit alpha [Burkholderia diffusa]|uniref:thiamine pyrophosphate-dependent dehydrogenase E1 component subunit alpha n=1 Tax=Burkholderia diffusa TaxID=488732 RepID=UPI00075D0844|nr:thiamine pyrophosphate-dependent dehydrogenase E1 component subunit alpha [Burkholderia diffusa]KVN06954.1 acetoin dehydrogenase [Burkholderia diffusa]
MVPLSERTLLEQMMRIRAVEEAIAAHYGDGTMRCPVHLSIGQEAVAVGVCAALTRADLVMSTHRAHAHYLAKGGDLNAMIAELHGKNTGCAQGRGGSMHLIDVEVGFEGTSAILGASIPIGVGLALALQVRGGGHVACAFFGDGATEEGVFYESLNFAALKRLPVLFVCENNQYSVYSPLAVRQPPGRSIVRLADALGVPGTAVDGNDVLAVAEKSRALVGELRRGAGPRLIECATWRWLEHCGVHGDDELGYRDPALSQAWRERDPIARLRAALIGSGSCDEAVIESFTAAIDEEVDAAFAFAERSPWPDRASCFDYVYGEAS